MEIISRTRLMGVQTVEEDAPIGAPLQPLPDCIVSLLNYHLEAMVEEGNNSAQIVTLREKLQRQVYDNRVAIITSLEAKGYTVVTNLGNEALKHNTGWRLHERQDGKVPEKLMTEGAPLHYRGDISYKNFKLFVEI